MISCLNYFCWHSLEEEFFVSCFLCFVAGFKLVCNHLAQILVEGKLEILQHVELEGNDCSFNCSLPVVIILPCLLFSRLNQKYFVCMVGCPHPLKPLTAYGILIVFKRFLMKGQCVICYGLTLMIDVVGVFLLVVLDILSAR